MAGAGGAGLKAGQVEEGTVKREVWFREDIGQALLAVGEASRSASGLAAELLGHASLLRAYQAGFQAALNSLALAFGLLDMAGSLPRSWVSVVDEEASEGGWTRALEPEVAVRRGQGGRGEVAREWMEEEWR